MSALAADTAWGWLTRAMEPAGKDPLAESCSGQAPPAMGCKRATPAWTQTGALWFLNEWLKSSRLGDTKTVRPAPRQISRMKRIGLAILSGVAGVAGQVNHDVPDLVNVAVLFKPENGRLRTLRRVPSNAFINFQFPVLDATWLDLSESEAKVKRR